MELRPFLERQVVPAGEPAAVGWVLRVVGHSGALPPAAPVNLALVLDASGSMAGGKLARVQEAARWVVRHLRGDDRVAVVAFDADVTVPAPAGPAACVDRLEACIASLRAGSRTNLSGGWAEGLAQVRAGWLPNGLNRVVLLTDGQANEGVWRPDRLAELARGAAQDAEAPVTTSTVGVGSDFAEDVLMSMAREGGGAYHYADSAERVGEVLRAELQDLQDVVAQNVVVELRPGPAVAAVSQLTSHPCAHERDERVLTFRLGDVSAGTFRRLGLDLSLAPTTEAEVVPVLSGRVRWFDVEADPPGPREAPLREAVRASHQPARAAPPDEEGLRELTVLRIARARRKATRAADQGDVEEARRILALARGAAEGGLLAADAAVREALHGLRRQERLLDQRPETYGHGTAVRKALTREVYEVTSATVRFVSRR